MAELLPLKQLKDDLTYVIQKQVTNMRLLNAINKEFTEKGFEIEIPTMLFNNEVEIDVLEEIEVLAVSKVCYEFLKENNIEINGVNINPSDYFTNSLLNEYDLHEALKEKRNSTVIFEECRKIDANNYWVYLTAEQLYNLRKNRNVQYFQGIQRMAKIVTLPNGLKIKKINVNKNGVKKMMKRIKEHTLRPTSIAFSLLLVEGKDPVYKFTPEYKNTGRFMIETDFDRNSQNYAPLIIPDGYHRREAYADIFAEDGNKIKEGLGVHIYLMTIPEAKQFVADVFERNETDEEYKESLNNTDNSSLFIGNIAENSNILRNNIVNTITEFKELKNSLSYLGVLKECVKYTKINIRDEVTIEREARKMAKVIDIMINYLVSKYFNDNIDNMRDTFLLAPNSFVGYIAIANVLKDNTDYKILAGDVADKLANIEENLISSLKLDTKDCDVKKIYDYFENIAKEVI